MACSAAMSRWVRRAEGAVKVGTCEGVDLPCAGRIGTEPLAHLPTQDDGLTTAWQIGKGAYIPAMDTPGEGLAEGTGRLVTGGTQGYDERGRFTGQRFYAQFRGKGKHTTYQDKEQRKQSLLHYIS